MFERHAPEDPKEWINRAYSSLIKLEDYKQAVIIVEKVVHWAENIVNKAS